MTHPINLGLVDALSRVGGGDPSRLPAMLDGIQPVLIYGDVSRTLASEVFEARAVSGQSVSGNPVFLGFELASRSPGGLVVESIVARVAFTGGVGTMDLGLNIVTTALGTTAVPKLDVGGVSTVGTVKHLATPPAFGALLAMRVDAIAGTLAFDALEPTFRIWVPPGSYFQVFPVAAGGVAIQGVGISVAWRELADAQGAP